MKINCDNHKNALSTALSFKPNGTNTTYHSLPVNGEKIKLTSTNVFNITRLVYNDSGRYNCTIIYGYMGNGSFLKDVTEHILIVLKEGKACMDR